MRRRWLPVLLVFAVTSALFVGLVWWDDLPVAVPPDARPAFVTLSPLWSLRFWNSDPLTPRPSFEAHCGADLDCGLVESMGCCEREFEAASWRSPFATGWRMSTAPRSSVCERQCGVATPSEQYAFCRATGMCAVASVWSFAWQSDDGSVLIDVGVALPEGAPELLHLVRSAAPQNPDGLRVAPRPTPGEEELQSKRAWIQDGHRSIALDPAEYDDVIVLVAEAACRRGAHDVARVWARRLDVSRKSIVSRRCIEVSGRAPALD